MRRHKSTGAERRRTDLVFALAAAVMLAGFAFLVVTLQGLSHDLRTANEARDALAQQVERLGESPVAGPPGSRGQPGASVIGPTGPPGDQGEPGEPGTPGPVGPTGPVGPSGSPGTDGSNGVGTTGPSGAAGTDGQSVVGPPGPAGPVGPKGDTGPAGEAGQDGKDGTDGRDGADGQTCPDGYSLQPPPDDPDALICRRTNASPPPADQSRGLLGLGALAATSMYRRLDG
ncbi:collagen-like protein [Streptomyces poriferorum]|uniref:Collagen-like protein n=1 Tax=Streptomyces poriferorum TaxID=2798799 RepID=A0ABY9J3H5_9ACTN|nr:MULTISPECIES: collagen-like protein [unclassified Streptomyces]MDP5310364.1 collagen-like protein [Streptomyces sp. Alt4]WLQ60481.1 collagen-like protein [Streptomyces sp. Alt2]